MGCKSGLEAGTYQHHSITDVSYSDKAGCGQARLRPSAYRFLCCPGFFEAFVKDGIQPKAGGLLCLLFDLGGKPCIAVQMAPRVVRWTRQRWQCCVGLASNIHVKRGRAFPRSTRWLVRGTSRGIIRGTTRGATVCRLHRRAAVWTNWDR